VTWSNIVIRGVAALLLALVIGCSGDGLVDISGTVTFAGESLTEGAISFHPLDDTLAPEGGQISSGVFQLRCPPGRYRVEIYASRAKVGGVELTPGMTPREQFIPAQYNANSSLEVDVSTAGPARFSFEIVPGRDGRPDSASGR